MTRYCPKCRSEFQDWVKVCVDCSTALTDQPPSKPPAQTRDVRQEILVTVATFSHSEQAYLSQSKLKYEGIWSFVADDHMVTNDWLISTALGGVKLQVKESDVEKAQHVLADVR